MSRIEVFADIVCPFTHVGLRRLSEARRGREVSPVVRVRAWPLELVNGRALDGPSLIPKIAALRADVVTARSFGPQDVVLQTALGLVRADGMALISEPPTQRETPTAVRGWVDAGTMDGIRRFHVEHSPILD
jgi:hypothetical protein